MLITEAQTGTQVRLPDFFIVGAAKSGTTSAHHYLSQHPQVCMPKQKETRFFSYVDSPPDFAGPSKLDNTVTNLDHYLSMFGDPGEDQKLGEACPWYLYLYGRTIDNMRKIYGSDKLSEVRIIVFLRQPADRAWSQYWTFKRDSQETLPYVDAVKPGVIQERLDANWNVFYDYLGFGRYTAQVKAYMEAFGKGNVRVYLFEDLTQDAAGLCRDLYRFLGVQDDFVPRKLAAYNVSGRPKNDMLARLFFSRHSTPLRRFAKVIIGRKRRDDIRHIVGAYLFEKVVQPESVRRELTAHFCKDIASLSELIGRDLSHWTQA